MLKKGDKAPDFTMNNQNGDPISLKDLKGKKVVLYFYPKDLTPGCTKESCDFNSNLKDFKKKDAVIFGVSFDNEAKHQKFIEKYSLGFDLLVDADKSVATAYGVYQKKKFLGKEYMGIVRSTFIIDEKGKIADALYDIKVLGHVKKVLAGI